MDFIIENHGSLVILVAQTEEAEAWAEAHLPDERMMWGASGTVVEPRYLGPIIEGIEADGLVVG